MTKALPSALAWTDVGTFPFRQIRRDRIGLVEFGKQRGGDYACGNVAGRFRIHLLSDPSGIHHVMVRNQRNYVRGEPEGSEFGKINDQSSRHAGADDTLQTFSWVGLLRVGVDRRVDAAVYLRDAPFEDLRENAAELVEDSCLPPGRAGAARSRVSASSLLN